MAKREELKLELFLAQVSGGFLQTASVRACQRVCVCVCVRVCICVFMYVRVRVRVHACMPKCERARATRATYSDIRLVLYSLKIAARIKLSIIADTINHNYVNINQLRLPLGD